MANQKIRESALRRLNDVQLGAVLGTSDWGRALAILWDRHAGLFYSTARSLCRNDDDARDAMSEALAKIAQRAADGSLQVEASFKSYAVMVVRNACHDVWRRTGRVDVTDDVEVGGGPGGSFLPDPVMDDVDEKFVAMAFSRLPERYRQVLWLTEVEGLPPREVADLLSMTPNNVSQIAVRARMALREGWAAEHLSQVDSSSPCHGFAKFLPAFAAGSLAAERVSMLQGHLAQCPDCSGLHTNLMADTMKLRGLALPIPVILTFRYLRGLAGGAAQTTGQGAGFFSQTFEVVRRSVGAVQALVTTGQNALLVGAGAVAAVATVGVGTFALTNIVGDSPRNGDAVVELGEPSSEDAGEQTPSPPSEEPAATAPPETAPSETAPPETTPPPPETTPPTNPPAPVASQPGLDFDFDLPGDWGGVPVGELQNDQIITLGSPIPLGSSRSWTYRGVAGTTILVSSSAGALDVIGSGGRIGEVGAANLVSPDNPFDKRDPGDWTLVSIDRTGTYTIVLRAWIEEVNSSTQMLVSVDNTEIQQNVLTPLDTELPIGLGRVWRFSGTAGEPIAVGVEGEQFLVAMLRSPSGTTQYCYLTCMLNESGRHAIAVVNNPYNRSSLPDTMSIDERVNQASDPTEAQDFDPFDAWPAGTGVEIATPTFDVVIDSPYELSAPISAGLHRIGRFTATAGEIRACFVGQSLGCTMVGTNGYWGKVGSIDQSGTNWIVLRSSATTPVVEPQYIEVASPAGSTDLETLNSIPAGHVGAFWLIEGSAGDIYSVYSPSNQAWLAGLPSTLFGGYGWGLPDGASSSTYVLGETATYFVVIERNRLAGAEIESQVTVSSRIGDLTVDIPRLFVGDIHDWNQSVWRFQATAGQVLFSSEGLYVFRISQTSDGTFYTDGLSYRSCPCTVTESGTYYLVSEPRFSQALPPTSIQIGTVRPLGINQPFTLASSVLANTQLNFSVEIAQPGEFEVEISDDSYDSVRFSRPFQYEWWGCWWVYCEIPSAGTYLLSIKAGDAGFPAGMQIKLSESTSGP